MLKTVAFTVRATAEQADRWRRAASAEGFLSVELWIAAAVDRWLMSLERPSLS